MKYSRGPWKVKFKKRCDWSIYSADGYSITGIPFDDEHGRPEEDAANARLIAAAPELLEYLKGFLTSSLGPDDIRCGWKLLKQIEGKDHRTARQIIMAVRKQRG